ncbi:MAG TPA: hypothetical protein DET40_11885 [Lentisphaeria bacterium]|nr:MAG: hypothetical protein A2X45_05975 [Lentisphaerae bacterium GWF2_50_93]HCE44239.1 hypothetical protein [Lentisphaeria bacterium]
MKCRHFIFSFPAVLVLACLFLAGCPKNSQVPEPPTARAQLVRELFTSLEKKDHESAIKKIERLRKLDTGNIFLANLERIETNNEMISQIQELVDQGKIDEAINLTNGFMLKSGRTDSFISILNELQVVKQLYEAVSALNDSANVTRLARNAAKIKMIASKYKPAEIFIPLANEKIALAKKMYTSEKRKAVDDLSIEITGMMSKKNPRAALLMAVLGIENPEHPVILNYLDYINDPSASADSTALGMEKQRNKR